MKASSKIALIAAGIAAVLFARQKGVAGIGKVERIKRRIYKEVSLAQHAGVDFSKKYDQLTDAEKIVLKQNGQGFGWKQSKRAKESGKPYAESYFNSLRRAWNAVSGVSGIGTAYNVKDANGNICLTWIEDAQAHVDAERRTLDAEQRAQEARKRLQKTRRQSQQLSMFGCVGYAQDVEHELWEIWREQLEYGETELDYDAWRRIYGDAYVESI